MRFIILGGGAVTTEFYLPALRIMGRLNEATIVDPDARSIPTRYPEFNSVDFRPDDYGAFLESRPQSIAPGGEAIIVALPNRLHVDGVSRALATGRHVLCEKPLALRKADCATLRKLAEDQGRLLKVAMSRRYLPSLMMMRDMIVGGEFGAVRAINVRDCAPFLWRPRSFSFFAPDAGGVLADMGVHYLDYLSTLVGALTPVSYRDDAKGGNESSLDYALRAGDVAIAMRLSRIHQSGAFIEVVCERGVIIADKSSENAILARPRHGPARRITAEAPFERPEWPNSFHGSFCQMLADFERETAGVATRLADAADAEQTVALIEWAYEQRAQKLETAPTSSEARSTALVTGATGFIGGHLLERLSSQPVDVRVAARSPANCANAARFPVNIVPTDLLDAGSVKRAVAGARIVYHLAYGAEGHDAARVTIEGAKNIIEAAIAARAECVVVLSTMYVFGFPGGDAAIDESFPYRPYGGEYGESKATMEKWCLERAKTSLPTRIVLLNPTCVFGPAGGAYTTLPIDLARKGQFCWIEDGSGSCNYNYVENLVDAVLAAAATPAAHGNRFIINDGVTTWRDLLGPFLTPLGATIPNHSLASFKTLPRFGGPFHMKDLIAAAASASAVRDIAKRSALVRSAFALANRIRPRPPMSAAPVGAVVTEDVKGDPPEWLATLYGPARAEFSAAKAQAILGWRPRQTLAQAQAETIAWLVENGRLPDAKAIASP